jgi:putative ABC transport system permease protein
MMKFLPLIFRNIFRNRRRTILSILSIGISMFVFALLMNLPAVVQQLLRDRVSALRLDCGSKGGLDYTLPVSYGETIRATPHVEAVSRAMFVLANYRDPGLMIPVIGADPMQMLAIYPDWGITPDTAAELERSRSSALVTPGMIKRFKWKLGDKIVLHVVNLPVDLDFTIIGVLGENSPESMVLVPFERINQMETNRDRAAVFFIRIDHADSAPAVIQAIDSRFANSAFPTGTQTELGLAKSRLSMLRLLFVGVELIAGIIVIVIATVAANTAAMSVRERRHELAVMRSIGFTRRMLVASVVIEGVLIGFAAGASGALLAYIVLSVVGPNLLFAGRIVFRLMPSVAAETIAIAAAIGLLSAAIPALNATRRDIAEALRATI